MNRRFLQLATVSLFVFGCSGSNNNSSTSVIGGGTATNERPSETRKSDPFSRQLRPNLRNTTMALSRNPRDRRRRHGVSDRAFNQFRGALR